MRNIPIVLVACLIGVLGASADIVRLKDGTKLEGTILSESSTGLTMEVELAHGTITRTQTLSRDEISEVIRSTPAERAEMEMIRAFESADKCRLDPSRSFELAYYDRVIDGVLRRFLTDYPNSPHEQQIKDKIVEWEEERTSVMAGKGKYEGRWMPVAEAKRLQEVEQSQQTLTRARDSLSHGDFEKALSLARVLATTSRQSEIQGQANRFQTEVYQAWRKSIEEQAHNADQEQQFAEQKLAAAEKSREHAQKNLQDFMGSHTSGVLGYESLRSQYQGVVQRAESDIIQCESRLGRLREERAAFQLRLSELDRRAGSLPKPAPLPVATNEVASAAPPPAPPPPPPATPETLSQIGGILQRYWAFGLVAILLVAWGCVRLFTH